MYGNQIQLARGYSDFIYSFEMPGYTIVRNRRNTTDQDWLHSNLSFELGIKPK